MSSPAKPPRTLKGRAFIALGLTAIALQAYNFYLFVGMIGR
jgi:hypothetical protein